MELNSAVPSFAPLPDRRRLLQGLAVAALAAPVIAHTAHAASPAPDAAPVTGRVLAMSDIHSAYDRLGPLLAALEAEVASQPVPHVIAIDGDSFEHGNVVTVRTDGVIDWAFLAELPKIAPTVFNIGNHDNDITTDLAAVVARLQGLGITVISNIIDTRTGAPYAPAAADVPFGPNRTLRVVGVATNSINTYPAASRADLTIPVPGEWARANLAQAMAGADQVLVMSHAGVSKDREILPLLPDGAHMIGGHNHLLFQHQQGRSQYAHTGSWAAAYTTLTLRADGTAQVTSTPVSATAAPSPRIADLIATTLAATLTPEETAVIGVSPAALLLGDTGRAVAAAMARAAGAQAGFIGHTTLGAGLPDGPVSRYAFDAIVRFDGKLMAAEVTPERLAQLMRRANQDRPIPFADRLGDFVYGASLDAAPAGPIRIVTTDWCATNQSEYFGVSDLAFTEVPDLRVKTVATAAIQHR